MEAYQQGREVGMPKPRTTR